MTTGLSPAMSSATKMPCWKPRWANCRPGTMSPTAYTCGRLVCSRSSVMTEPRTKVMPASSYPQPAVAGPRPTATSSRSAFSSVPSSSSTVTPESSWVTLLNRTPVLKPILRLRNARSTSLAAHGSSSGTRVGSASTMVTSVPKEAQVEANSTPMTPPPSTMAVSGTHSRLSAWVEVMTRPSISRPGSDREYEPVARMTSLPMNRSFPTTTLFGPTNLPTPSTTWMPRDLTRPCRPLYRRVMMPSLYLSRAAVSIPSKVDFTPMEAPSRASSATSAACSNVLAGTQPQCRQVPPSFSFSIRATDMPSSAARRAAAYPPEPPPRTTRSTLVSVIAMRSCSQSGRRPNCTEFESHYQLRQRSTFGCDSGGMVGWAVGRCSQSARCPSWHPGRFGALSTEYR